MQNIYQVGKRHLRVFCRCFTGQMGWILLNRREQIEAMEQKRPIKHLNSFDYLMEIDDFSRFCFKKSPVTTSSNEAQFVS